MAAAFLGALLTGEALVLAVFAPVFLGLMPRSLRRHRAAKRIGLVGFVNQLPAVSEAERKRKVDALSGEVGDWEPGRVWVRELDERLVGRTR